MKGAPGGGPEGPHVFGLQPAAAPCPGPGTPFPESGGTHRTLFFPQGAILTTMLVSRNFSGMFSQPCTVILPR